MGKNPSDVWEIPNVKWNHVEKTKHPCQFPVELVERLVLSMTGENDLVVDPYVGVGSSLIAAVRHNRRGAGSDITREYLEEAQQRLCLEEQGLLKTRPMNTPLYKGN